MARWGVGGSKNASAVQSILVLTAASSSPRRARLYEYNVGSGATPADLAFIHIIQRCSTSGTGTSQTPNALDPADSLASTIVTKDAITSDPTITSGAVVWKIAINQRLSYSWYANGDNFSIVIPATASNGFMCGLSATTSTTFDSSSKFEEL